MKAYPTPAAFKVALNARLRARAREAALPVDRLRTLAVMERFLARFVAVAPASTLLKGGLALELRFARARTTKDMDLRLLGDPEGAAALIHKAGSYKVDPDDHLRFFAEPDPDHPVLHGDGAVYEGHRFRVRPMLAGDRYGDVFGVDVSFADVVSGAPTELVGGDIFAFIGVPPLRVQVYPLASHLAEKLHAYTLPRRPGVENSRVKDLPDIALIAGAEAFEAIALRAAIRATFSFRATHPAPAVLPSPPAAWGERYSRLAAVDELPWATLPELVRAVEAFLNPLLQGGVGLWEPGAWQWTDAER